MAGLWLAMFTFTFKKTQTLSSLYRVLRPRQFVVIKNKGHREKLLIILRHPVFSKVNYRYYSFWRNIHHDGAPLNCTPKLCKITLSHFDDAPLVSRDGCGRLSLSQVQFLGERMSQVFIVVCGKGHRSWISYSLSFDGKEPRFNVQYYDDHNRLH